MKIEKLRQIIQSLKGHFFFVWNFFLQKDFWDSIQIQFKPTLIMYILQTDVYNEIFNGKTIFFLGLLDFFYPW